MTWLNGFSKRKPITITNPVSVAGYQHSLTVPYVSGMKTDFADLRFTDANGNCCPYWLESKTDSTSANVWINVPTTNQNQLWVYYGNAGAVSESNGDRVFDFFDDFLGSSLDGNKWSPTYMTTAVSGGICQGTANNAAGGTYKSTTYPFKIDMCMTVRYKQSAFNSNTYSQITVEDSGTTNTINIVGLDDATKDGYAASSKAGASSGAQNLSLTSTYWTNYGVWRIYRISSTQIIITRDASTVWNYTTAANIPTVDLAPKIIAYPNGDSIYLDYIFVRKYTSTEPTLSLGTEETLTDPVTFYPLQREGYRYAL